MASDDEILELLASGAQMVYAEWPGLLDRILPRLEHIAYNDFPLPRIPIPEFVPSSQKEERTSPKREPSINPEPQEESPATAKEEISNGHRLRTKQETPTRDTPPSTVRPEPTPTTPPPNTIAPPPHTLPPPLLSLLQTIQSTLQTSFPTSPPHTSQRLAELLLHPTRHYRALPSYLRALDRIVSVASPASIFPLPDLTATANSLNTRLLNGTSSPTTPDPTSEENFIGGAELTEIPWLRNRNPDSPSSTATTALASDLRTESKSVIDGPNGAGSIETVTVNVNGNGNGNTAPTQPPRAEDPPSHGITQGELLRQEQEAGIVPVPSTPHNSRVTRSSAASAAAAATRAVGLEPSEEGGVEEGDQAPEPVHARGPGVIGMEDMGPQAPGSGLEDGLDLEGALGRRGEGEVGRGGEEGKGGGEKDGEGDVVVADADGVIEEEEGGSGSGSGEGRGADAGDGTPF